MAGGKAKGSKAPWIVFAVVVLGGGGLVVCCSGLVGLVFFGSEMLEQQIGQELAANPALQAHIGTLEELDYDLMASGEYPEIDITVYNARGSRGTAQIVVKSITQGTSEVIVWAVLDITNGDFKTGERIILVGSPPPDLP